VLDKILRRQPWGVCFRGNGPDQETAEMSALLPFRTKPSQGVIIQEWIEASG